MVRVDALIYFAFIKALLLEKQFHCHTLGMSMKIKKVFCDARIKVKMKVYFTIILMMLSGIVCFLMALLINLELVVQYSSRDTLYTFAHLLDQKIKECITAASQMDPAVKAVM